MTAIKKHFIIYEDIGQDGKPFAKRYNGTVSFKPNGLFELTQNDGTVITLNVSKVIKMGEDTT